MNVLDYRLARSVDVDPATVANAVLQLATLITYPLPVGAGIESVACSLLMTIKRSYVPATSRTAFPGWVPLGALPLSSKSHLTVMKRTARAARPV